MLEGLRGQAHEVVTGVAVVAGERVAADSVHVEMRMRDYSGAEIEAYIARGEPFDKAGAYAIQDEVFRPVASLAGCECAVIGLPLWTARRLLRAAAGLETPRPDRAFERCGRCPLAED
jgi:septum formation protein